MGYIAETGVEQHERDIRIAAIYEGTNGIQAMDLVARKLPMRGGAVGAGAPRPHRRRRRRRAELADAVAALREATEWLLAKGLEDPRNALAGATPYLRLFGTVLGGWFLARQADAAGDGDPPVATARYYFEQVLPTARGLVPAVTAGADALFAILPTASELESGGSYRRMPISYPQFGSGLAGGEVVEVALAPQGRQEAAVGVVAGELGRRAGRRVGEQVADVEADGVEAQPVERPGGGRTARGRRRGTRTARRA